MYMSNFEICYVRVRVYLRVLCASLLQFAFLSVCRRYIHPSRRLLCMPRWDILWHSGWVLGLFCFGLCSCLRVNACFCVPCWDLHWKRVDHSHLRVVCEETSALNTAFDSRIRARQVGPRGTAAQSTGFIGSNTRVQRIPHEYCCCLQVISACISLNHFVPAFDGRLCSVF